jgi:hypothetical protein
MIYAEWLPLLDRFRDGDDSVLQAMRDGTIEWTNVVAERWTSRVAEVLSGRLKLLSAKLQLAFDRSAGDMFAISQAMLGARRSLIPLFALASLPCAPGDVKRHLQNELERFIQQTQESLERGARIIRNDNGRVLKVLRDHPLIVPSSDDISSAGSSAIAPPESALRVRRPIL